LWLRRLQDQINPDVVNVHYATGYGTLARMARLSAPVLLSVWGSDVYDFPKRNRICEWLLRGNLASATRLASTSVAMAGVASQYAPGREFSITPFGVDTDLFVPMERQASERARIGTVKSMRAVYGIDDLITAFSIVAKDHTEAELHLYGDGPDTDKLRALAESLGVADSVVFHGAIPHEQVPAALNEMDVFAALSPQIESFGVAIIEAGACGLPVVVSDVDGPAEVVENDATGIVVPRRNPEAAARAINRLLEDEDVRRAMGAAGRAHVVAEYSWRRSLDLMERAYADTILGAARASERRAGRPGWPLSSVTHRR
jgi:glycosyltransferase involved in cell wall biosynthesis